MARGQAIAHGELCNRHHCGRVCTFLELGFFRLAVTEVAGALPAEYGSLVLNVSPDFEIFTYALAVSLLAGVFSGLTPAIESARAALASATRAATARSRRLQEILVAGQVALSLLLMIAGGMFIRSSLRSLKLDPGYESKHLLSLDLQFPGSPGSGRTRTEAETLGVPVLRGRVFKANSSLSVVVSESFAKQTWPGRNAVGRQLRLSVSGTSHEVTGAVRDKCGAEFDASESEEIYLPLMGDQLAGRPLLVQTRANSAQAIRWVEQTVAAIDPSVVITTSTLDEMLRRSAPFIVSSLAAVVVSAVGFLGLMLAAMGIYDTVCYLVVLRTREVGIRMALGAQRGNIFALILSDSARPVLAGLVGGTVLAVAMSYLARGLFYELNGIDGVAVAVVSLSFLIIALLAAYPPARRATRIDPMAALS